MVKGSALKNPPKAPAPSRRRRFAKSLAPLTLNSNNKYFDAA